MVDAAPSLAGGDNLERWEEELIRSVAASYNTPDRDDLAAELAWRLLVLKRQRRLDIRNWRAYITKFLRNKASNWIRKNRPLERRTVSLDEPISTEAESGPTLVERLQSSEANADERLALEAALKELPSELRNALRVLIEENSNQSATAQRLHKHRNTIRAWICRIQKKLAAFGLAPEPETYESVANPVMPARVNPPMPALERRKMVVFPCTLLEALTKHQLSGMEWRAMLWVVRQSAERKQKTVPFSWHAIARAIAADRAGLGRAGRKLLRSALLFTERGRIGVQRNANLWRFKGQT